MDVQALTPGAITVVSGDVGVTAGFNVERMGAGFQFSNRGSRDWRSGTCGGRSCVT